MKNNRIHIFWTALFAIGNLLFGNYANAQIADTILIPPQPTINEIMKDWGPNDSVKVAAIWYGTNPKDFKMMPYALEEDIWISNLSPAQIAKVKAETARLRNAVIQCYPYAREAGWVINELNKNLEKVSDRSARKAIIKSKEKELKKKFSDPLKNLSVYQGRVLMKLINRQTGNSCYELLKEYKGGFSSALYQATAFVYGSSLKQTYDLSDKFDHQIEIFVREIDANLYNNPFRR